MKMSGKGLKKVSGYGYGDHYIHIKIDVPKKLDEKQLALMTAWAEIEPGTPGTMEYFFTQFKNAMSRSKYSLYWVLRLWV